MSEYPEATNLRGFLTRVSHGLGEQAAGAERLDAESMIAHNLRAYAGQLDQVAEHVRYDGTVDWAEVTGLYNHSLVPTLPELVSELDGLTRELEERLDNPPESDDLDTKLRELESRIDDLEG